MARLGTYSYPDIRFGDAVEIAGRILAKFKGSVTVKGLAWELGMAEGSGTLFAKIAALRDFGLVEGRGELRVSDLTRRIIYPAMPEERREASTQAFQRVELLRALYQRFEGEAPDDSSLLIALEEITKAPREEIVRRFTIIQKHLTDASRVMQRSMAEVAGHSLDDKVAALTVAVAGLDGVLAINNGQVGSIVHLVVGEAVLTFPLTKKYVGVATQFLKVLVVAQEAAETLAATESG